MWLLNCSSTYLQSAECAIYYKKEKKIEYSDEYSDVMFLCDLLNNILSNDYREDYMVEAMEIVEMYCDLVLARFGLVTQMKELDEGLAEAISTLIWVAPRMHTDVQVS